MLNSISQIESADYKVCMLAQVVDNVDPDKKQRIKVRVPMLLDQPKEQLPWVLRVSDSPFGFGANFGTVSVPPIDAWVMVYFEQGNLLYGQWIGSTPLKETSLPVLEENYPHRYGMRDPKGNHFYVDTQAGTVQFQHHTGTRIDVANNGDAMIHCVGKINSTAQEWTHNGPMILNGNQQVNGAVTVSQSVSAGGTVSGPTVSASSSLKVAGKEVNGHTHPNGNPF